MDLEIQEDLTPKQKVTNNMLDKVLIVTLYAIPTIGLLIFCYVISRKK